MKYVTDFKWVEHKVNVLPTKCSCAAFEITVPRIRYVPTLIDVLFLEFYNRNWKAFVIRLGTILRFLS